jgi:hypothetical protein
VLRAVLGWKTSSIRADLKDVLEDATGETGFSPTERIMLRNILRERRIADGWFAGRHHRRAAEISLGELMKVLKARVTHVWSL